MILICTYQKTSPFVVVLGLLNLEGLFEVLVTVLGRVEGLMSLAIGGRLLFILWPCLSLRSVVLLAIALLLLLLLLRWRVSLTRTTNVACRFRA